MNNLSLGLLAMASMGFPSSLYSPPQFNLNKSNNQDALASANAKIEAVRNKRLQDKANRNSKLN